MSSTRENGSGVAARHALHDGGGDPSNTSSSANTNPSYQPIQRPWLAPTIPPPNNGSGNNERNAEPNDQAVANTERARHQDTDSTEVDERMLERWTHEEIQSQPYDNVGAVPLPQHNGRSNDDVPSFQEGGTSSSLANNPSQETEGVDNNANGN
ncbi:MAG: hypothetical protein M1820_002219 [Bogoriella megaspora]|nr:MAG: hypothetical protein M1820_002219 [Bogoriella megaspora]